MEVTVWVDGCERVVCGITETTTCQEIIYALAHATGRTGRFVLVEQWRSSERSLAPSDHPLELLNKWGEYARDVKFVMKFLEAAAKSPTAADGAKTATGAARSAMGAFGVKPFLVSPHSATLRQQHHPQQQVSVMSRSTHETSFDTSNVVSDGQSPAASRGRTTTPIGGPAMVQRPRSIGAPRTAAATVVGGRQRPAQPPPYEEALLRSKRLTAGTPMLAPAMANGGSDCSFELMSSEMPTTSVEELTRLVQKQERILAEQSATMQKMDMDYQLLNDQPVECDVTLTRQIEEAEGCKFRLQLELQTLRSQVSSEKLSSAVQKSLELRRDVDSSRNLIAALAPQLSAAEHERKQLETDVAKLQAEVEHQETSQTNDGSKGTVQSQPSDEPIKSLAITDVDVNSNSLTEINDANGTKPPGVWV